MINVIRDEKLKAALNEIYLNQPIDHNITEDQLVKLTGVLELENKGIKDLTGINYASHLTGLYLNKNEIEDLTPLRELVHLRQLSLMGNQIKDLKALSSMTQTLCGVM